ncbi:hypothetical protein [Cytophaga aurantiaca]|uniref:hypothetical protein n=1 Tax=Cytophaga aurantiaca TaxID=29530 RepID=UPI00037F26F4|nr:hypothetical protein [Cytophaga aurantiaca]
MINDSIQKWSFDKRLLFQFLFTTVLLSIPALYNKYPLFVSDSGTYLVTLFDKRNVPMDRPFGYGFIMRFVSMKLSLWPIILFQNLIATILIWKIIKRFFEVEKVIYIHMAVCSILLLASSLPWYSNQIMPDIFTPFIILILYLFFTSVSNYKWFYMGILFFFVMTHFSNFPILIFSTGTIAALMYFFKINTLKTTVLKSLVVCGVAIAGFVSICLQSYVNNQGFVFSHSSDVFLTGRLSETGLLKTYLQDQCASAPSPLCRYTDSLSNSAADFIWNDQSALNKVSRTHFNGAQATGEEKWHYLNNEVCKPVVKDIFTTPKYLSRFLYYGIRESVIQFFQINIGAGLSQYGYNSAPFWPIRDHVAAELPAFLSSEQNTRHLDFDLLNVINYVVLLLSVCIFWFACIQNQLSKELKVFCLFIVFSIYWNAFFTAALANVYDRLQARVTWLFVFAAILIAVKMIQLYRENKISNVL